MEDVPLKYIYIHFFTYCKNFCARVSNDCLIPRIKDREFPKFTSRYTNDARRKLN